MQIFEDAAGLRASRNPFGAVCSVAVPCWLERAGALCTAASCLGKSAAGKGSAAFAPSSVTFIALGTGRGPAPSRSPSPWRCYCSSFVRGSTRRQRRAIGCGTHIVKYSTTTAVDTSRRHRKQLTPVGALTRDPWQTSARRIFGADLPRSRRGTVPTIYVSVQCIPCGHSIWLSHPSDQPHHAHPTTHAVPSRRH